MAAFAGPPTVQALKESSWGAPSARSVAAASCSHACSAAVSSATARSQRAHTSLGNSARPLHRRFAVGSHDLQSGALSGGFFGTRSQRALLRRPRHGSQVSESRSAPGAAGGGVFEALRLFAFWQSIRHAVQVVQGAGRALFEGIDYVVRHRNEVWERWANIIRATFLGVSVLVTGFLASVFVAACARTLPDFESLNAYVPRESIYIYDANGELITNINGEGNRIVVPLERISPNLKLSVLAIEDRAFYSHPGVNPKGILRALVTNTRGGKVSQGGSTLTMQLIKNLYLSPRRTITRKLIEAILALRLERKIDKDKILELYLNQIYWGHNQCGAETAARNYFGKSAAELTLGEAAMMAGLIQAPEAYSPFVSMEFAKQRQETVLRALVELNWITPQEADAARAEKLSIDKLNSQMSHAPYVTDAVLNALNERFGKDVVSRGGLFVQTTIDLKMQRAAQNAVRKGYDNLRRGGVKAQQMALVAVDPQTHFIKAMVGGIDFYRSQFNRALNSYRQPGSTFKPYVYYAALASGKYGPESTVLDSPVTYTKWGVAYSPRNYDGGFYGPISVRRALQASRNVPVVRLGQEFGVDNIVDICRQLGMSQPAYPAPSMVLGTVDMSPLEVANSYSTFASGGWHAEPTFIFQVKDRHGHVLWDSTPQQRLVLDPDACAALTNLLQSVVDAGTGRGAKLPDRPAAGKTGTTSSERDVWFVGYTPQLSCAIWVGNDDNRTLGGRVTGGGHVAPIWRDFMTEALRGYPVIQFPPIPSQYLSLRGGDSGDGAYAPGEEGAARAPPLHLRSPRRPRAPPGGRPAPPPAAAAAARDRSDAAFLVTIIV
eukprot:tig00021432_g21198.t1